MLELILLVAAATVAVSAYNRFDTLSPKLFLKELGHWAGFTVKSTPSVVKASVETVKTVNKAADLHVAESGIEAKIGFSDGKEVANKAVVEPLNRYIDDEKRKQAIIAKKLAKVQAILDK